MSNLIAQTRRLFKAPFLEKTLRFFVKCFGFEVFRYLVPTNTEYNNTTIRYAKVDGIKYQLDISSFNSWCVYWLVEAEKRPKRKLYNLLNEDFVIIDIGAHIGETSLNMAKAAPNGMVYGFEPHPVTYLNLQVNSQLNKFDNLRIFNCAIGDIKTHVKMHSNVSNAGANYIVETKSQGGGVEMVTLDQFCSQMDLKRIDLIKVDVEGYEIKALIGCKEALDKYNPSLFIEMSDLTLKQCGFSAYDLYDYLIQQGYTKIIDIRTNKQIDATYNFEKAHTDILVLPK